MHWKQLSLSILVLFCLGFSIGELKMKYPHDYFRSPIDYEIRLSGTFGELRPNHFHSGIDIKSKSGGVGQPIYAVADGFVERINVRSGGYGNALYIRHPNGYTSVYAHLNKFDKEIAEYVKTAQYVKKSFSVDLYPDKSRFSFKQGDIKGNA